MKILRDHTDEIVRNPVRFPGVAVPAQAFERDDLCRRPGVGKIPLALGFIGAHDEAAGLFEFRKIFHQRSSLLLCGDAGPERVIGGDVDVPRAFFFAEVVIEEESGLRVPQIFLDLLLSRFGSFGPVRGFGLFAEQLCHFFQIFFGFVEEAVQADWGEVVRGGAVRPEAERDIETRFAHGTVGAIKIAA